ncbi:MAG TPA: VWA domain-containing protein, partial [Thermoanaerobaculia bacterium]|nr:VWA domain-containing protein [Thermoanaerobaculia bacterium]
EPAGPETVAAAFEPAAPAIPARDEPSLRLLVPTDRLVTGKLRVEAATRGEEIAAIAFSVDGKPILRKLRPPFGVELDLGKSPRMRRIGAVAYDAAGAELARQETVVNGGPHRFALRLVEPRSIPAGAERVVARAEIELPEGERLDRVEFHVNDQLYATLFQEPFVQSLPIVAGTDVAWIRAVAFLRGGGAAEDVKLVGAEGLNEELDVDLVELHASVLDRQSRPVLGLGPAEFQVYEDGVRQELRRCEFQTDLPIHAGVMIDTSSSMAEELADAQRAALQFFTEVLTERDRGAIVTFAEVPDLEVRFTNSVEVLAGGLSGIEAEGNTHLWDAVAFALHYFSGLRSKRILVLITDGEDSGSRFTYDEVLDYARRTGVAIYVIGLDVPSKAEVELRIDRLARETGGRSFRIGHARELGGIYREIQTELRSQYLIAYQSSAGTGNDFREVEVRLTRPGLEARTLRGYYP